MNKYSEITLHLDSKDLASTLNKRVYENELQHINAKFPLDEGAIDIKKTYLTKVNDNLEVGFFIRNATQKKISFKLIQLTLQDEHGAEVCTRIVDLEDKGMILSKKARHFIVNFDIDKNTKINNLSDWSIKFSSVNELFASESTLIEIENMPEDIPFEEEAAIISFCKNLASIKPNTVDINVYKIVYEEEGMLACIVLFRNGTNKAVTIKSMPITIVDSSGELAKEVFGNENGIASINSKKSKLIKFDLRLKRSLGKDFDLTTLKVIFN